MRAVITLAVEALKTRRCSKSCLCGSTAGLVISPKLIWELSPFAILMNFTNSLWRVASAKLDHLERAPICVLNLRIWKLLAAPKWREHPVRNPGSGLRRVVFQQAKVQSRNVEI